MTAETDTGYDAVVLLSFGGPEKIDDVAPFLANVSRGREIPEARLRVVTAQYERFGGRSPINAQNRALVAALRAELAGRGIEVPVRLANRNWSPYLNDVVAELAAAGHQRVLAIATSAFGSYSGCRQYLENLQDATPHNGGVELHKAGLYWNHPGFLRAFEERLRSALSSVPAGARNRVVFTAHSLPAGWAGTSPYVDQLSAAAGYLASAVEETAWDLAFQSRSGPPQVPWLGPDIVDHLGVLATGNVDHVTIVPLGFVSDHMEVAFDLDVAAREAADELGLGYTRCATPGTHPAFVSALADLVTSEDASPPEVAVTPRWANPCPPHCCQIPEESLR